MKKYLVALLVVLASIVGVSSDADALADPLGRIRSYQITCDTTARKLAPTSGYVPTSAFKFKNGSATIFLGGSDVNGTTAGYSYAASAEDAIDAAPGVVWCYSATSSVVTVIAGTKG